MVIPLALLRLLLCGAFSSGCCVLIASERQRSLGGELCRWPRHDRIHRSTLRLRRKEGAKKQKNR